MAKSLMSTSPFLGGLNTELNGVTDSTDFTKDELNMMIRQDNTRSRRPGVDYEELFSFNTLGKYSDILDMTVPNLAFNCIEWTDINSPDESQTYAQTPYIVCQVGGYIIFFENKGAPYSGNQKDFAINLKDYRLDDTDDTSYMTERCKFTTAYGCLFITSKAIRPIRLKSAQDNETSWTPTSTLPHCRVSCGIVNGRFTNTEGRSSTIHWWFKINDVEIYRMNREQQIQQYPQYVYYPRDWAVPVGLTSTQFAEIWNNIPSSDRLGIVCTPKYENARPIWGGIDTGHGEDGWAEYYTPPDYLEFTAPEGSELAYKGTKISWGGVFNQSDGNNNYNNSAIMSGGNVYTNQSGLTLTIRDTSVGANDYLSNETAPEKISYAHLYNLLNQGWTLGLIADYYISAHAFPGNNLAQQYLKDKTTEAFKPTALINTTFGDTPAARGHFILNFFNQDRNNIAFLQLAMSNLVTTITSKGGTATLQSILDTFDKPFPSTIDEQKAMAAEQVPVIKPRRPYVTDMCAYAGRIFYLCGDVLLYSQIIAEDNRKAAYCYSEADPTSEQISDVVETDGGLISLPEIGEGIKLQQFGSYLMVFGTRGSVLITGTANNNFTATAYTTGTLPAAPTQAPDSFVETEYGIFYWGTTCIQLIGSGEGGIAAKDISTERILTWFGKITNTQHQYCKGIYSSSKKKVYWFFPSDDEKPRRLDRVLVFDIMKNAFMPYQIASEIYTEEGTLFKTNVPEIVSGVALKVPFKNIKEYPVSAETDEDNFEVVDDNGIKILADDPIESEEFTYESSLLLCLDVNNGKVTFGDFRNNNMRDWTSGDWQGPGYTFDSYLISHPMNAFGYTQVGNRGSDIAHNKNMPYLISYFKRTETGRTTDGGYVYPSKCQGSVLWDWRTNGDYGKWDSPQELYRPNKREIFSEGYVVTKTNVRGLGRAYQVKMESVEDNQFIIEAISNDLMGDGRI